MEFFQELTFTVLLALILSIFLSKIVSFAVSNSNNNENAVNFSINESTVKDAILSKGLSVQSPKSKKRVRFVDDVIVRRVNRYEIENGSTNLGMFNDVESVREIAVVENSVDQNAIERVDQLRENGSSGDSVLKISEKDKGSVNIEMLMDEMCESDKIDEPKSVIVEELEEEMELKYDEGWEGIERSELEKVFAEAVNFFEYGVKEKGEDQLGTLGSDVLMKLYGLHKVAVEGQCYEPQPMVFKVDARAKWNAWQKLGSMSQEMAMEEYIQILSDNIPGWMQDYSPTKLLYCKIVLYS